MREGGIIMTFMKVVYDCKDSEDGFSVKQFKADAIYDVRENCARTLFARGAAVKPTQQEINQWENDNVVPNINKS